MNETAILWGPRLDESRRLIDLIDNVSTHEGVRRAAMVALAEVTASIARDMGVSPAATDLTPHQKRIIANLDEINALARQGQEALATFTKHLSAAQYWREQVFLNLSVLARKGSK